MPYMPYKPSFFFLNGRIGHNSQGISTRYGSSDVVSRKEVPFGGLINNALRMLEYYSKNKKKVQRE